LTRTHKNSLPARTCPTVPWKIPIVVFFSLIVHSSPLEAGQKEGPLRYPDLRSGGIAIGGVTIADSVLERRDAMAQIFEIHFTERRRDLRLTGYISARLKAIHVGAHS